MQDAREWLRSGGGGGFEGGDDGIRACTMSAECAIELMNLFAAEAVRSEREDKERLDWLEEHEAQVVSHRERFGGDGGWTIWWNVVKRGKSISGHPLGTIRGAIDAAVRARGKS